jgi:hypothetical protein
MAESGKVENVNKFFWGETFSICLPLGNFVNVKILLLIVGN